MKKLLFLLTNLFFAANIFGQTVGLTSTSLNVRSDGSINAKVISILPKGTAVIVNGCEGDWCQVSYSGTNGYASGKFLYKENTGLSYAENGRLSKVYLKAESEIKYYTNVNYQTVQSPTAYNQIPAEATAVCRDGTYSFSRNRRGTCSHHGGVKSWL